MRPGPITSKDLPEEREDTFVYVFNGDVVRSFECYFEAVQYMDEQREAIQLETNDCGVPCWHMVRTAGGHVMHKESFFPQERNAKPRPVSDTKQAENAIKTMIKRRKL